MKYKFFFYSLIIISFTIVSCNSQSPKQPRIDTTAIDEEQIEDSDSNSPKASLVIDEELEAEEQQSTEQQPQEPQQNKTAKAKAQAPTVGGKETLYISTYAANGKVWGHVTMNGNRGHGTIHDDDENSYTITVTRHGGELHGIDQNGRGYVFRM